MSVRNRRYPRVTDSAALSERVYRAVLQMLAQGTLAANEPLRIEELAKALEVSQTPVREALARLEATGLIERLPRKGYRVPPPLDPGQLRDLMESRRLIEVAAVIRAFHAGGSGFATALRRAVADQRAAVEAYQGAGERDPDVDDDLFWDVIEADLRFHSVIIEHSGNSFLALLADALQGQQHRIRQSAEHGLSDAVEALAEHTAISAAVESGDPSAVEKAMEEHLNRVGQRAGAAAAVD